MEGPLKINSAQGKTSFSQIKSNQIKLNQIKSNRIKSNQLILWQRRKDSVLLIPRMVASEPLLARYRYTFDGIDKEVCLIGFDPTLFNKYFAIVAKIWSFIAQIHVTVIKIRV